MADGARPGDPDHRLRAPVRDLQARGAAVHRRGAAGAAAVGRGAAGPDRLRGQGPSRRPAGPARDPGDLRAQPLGSGSRAACSSSRTTTSASAATWCQGVDVWLNNPRRPLEASGTSGMKAAMNGVVNCSVLDGWWDEGWTGAQRLGHRRPRDEPRRGRPGLGRRAGPVPAAGEGDRAALVRPRRARPAAALAGHDARVDREHRSGSSRPRGCSRSTSSSCTCPRRARKRRRSRWRRLDRQLRFAVAFAGAASPPAAPAQAAPSTSRSLAANSSGLPV